jgi:hypothetical protein
MLKLPRTTTTALPAATSAPPEEAVVGRLPSQPGADNGLAASGRSKSSTGRPRSPAVPRSNISRLPVEVLDHVAAQLPAKDLLSVVACDPAIGERLPDRLDAALAEQGAAQVEALPAFEKALAAATAVRPGLRGAPLLQLGQRIHRLGDDRDEALGPFRRAVEALSARHTVPGLAELPHTLRHETPADALDQGTPVLAVALAFEKSTPEEIRRLEDLAIYNEAPRSVGKQAENGGHVANLAAAHDILTPEGLRTLEDNSIHSPHPGSAAGLVRRGVPPRQAAAAKGLSEAGRQRLQTVADRLASPD